MKYFINDYKLLWFFFSTHLCVFTWQKDRFLILGWTLNIEKTWNGLTEKKIRGNEFYLVGTNLNSWERIFISWERIFISCERI
jgi:hypothetical protein